ncbi:MAG: alpha/beta fold hydrolase [Conexibacter sp.]
MPEWSSLQQAGTALAYLDYGGSGPPAILLHGLAGHAGEWRETAEWLTETFRVVALDARGHGRSERLPADVSREAHVADVALVVEQLRLGPAVVLGQSLGGLSALIFAARRPELVRGVVIADASPAGADDAAEAAAVAAEVAASLKRWPVPFATREAAVAFFGVRGYGSLAAEAWADGLEQCDGGWQPAFEVNVMERTLHAAIVEDHWGDWERIQCPALVVRAGAGIIPAADAHAMVDRLPDTTFIELPGAAHDLHLDQPARWRDVVSAFLSELA